MGPCSLLVRTRCPELGRWFSAAPMGRKELATPTIAAGVYFLKYLGAQMRIAGACCWTPAPPPLSGPPVIRSGLMRHLVTLACSHLAHHLKPCPPPRHPLGHQGVSLVSGGYWRVLPVLVPNPLCYRPFYLFSWMDPSWKVLSSKLYKISIAAPSNFFNQVNIFSSVGRVGCGDDCKELLAFKSNTKD